MQDFIIFVLSNFTLTFLVIGFVTASLEYGCKRKKKTTSASGIYLAHLFFFSYGCSYFYNFVMHVFFGEMSAHFIGWQQSPFQLEVGFASFGFSLIGFMAAFSTNVGFRVAAIVGVGCFLWGAAGGHIYQMITQHNFAPGNAGIIFWTDIFKPIITMVLFYMDIKSTKKLRK